MKISRLHNRLDNSPSNETRKRFNIIEYATKKTNEDGTELWNRHHFCKMNESFAFPAPSNQFKSHFLHSKEIVKYFQTKTCHNKKTISGYNGSISIDSVVFDIDNQNDLNKSLKTLKKFLLRLKTKYGINRQYIIINFSGKKGFHVRIPAIMFGGFEASVYLNEVVKKIMLKMTEGLEGFDESIYKKISLVRIINSKHTDTGLYAIPLTTKDIRNKSIQEIKELAKIPRNIKNIEKNDLQPYQILVDLKNECMINKDTSQKYSVHNNGSVLIKKISTGQRHNERLKLIRTMVRAGATLNEIKKVALYNNKKNRPIDKENELTIIKEIEEMHSAWVKKIKFFRINDKGFVKISYKKYLEFLEKNGYAKYCIGTGYVFVRNENNCLAEVKSWQIKDFVRKYLSSVKDGDNAYEYMLQRGSKCFSESFLEHLQEINASLIKDTIDTCNFFFKNCVVTVNNNSDITIKSYHEIDGLIWKDNIKERNFLRGKGNGDFREFIKNVSRSKKRYNFLRSILGYLMHRYKNPSYAKAVILYDEKVALIPMGRTGKSIIGKAISKLRNEAFFDGRNFNFKNQFAFQQVKLESEFINCNDVEPKFPLESFFSIITDNMIVERKNQTSYTIPFSESPKILISTNFALQGIGDSYKDRKIEFEFSDHYSANHKPEHDFGKLFFDQWDEDEWSRFDNFMINCVKYYLRNGVKEVASINVNKRRIIDATSEEFYKFVHKQITVNDEYIFGDLYHDYNLQYPEDTISPNMFTKWLKKYAEHMDYNYKERKSNVKKYITLKKRKLSAEI